MDDELHGLEFEELEKFDRKGKRKDA